MSALIPPLGVTADVFRRVTRFELFSFSFIFFLSHLFFHVDENENVSFLSKHSRRVYRKYQ